jgi:type II secretory pathway pseudopilin PulG
VGVGDRGFSLIEVLISAGLLIVIAAGVAQVLVMAVRAGDAARMRTTATIAAVQKMEQLRSLQWSDRPDVTTDLSADPATDAGPGLQPSPGGTLESNVPPFVDHLTEAGAWTGRAADPGAAAVYTRRWSVRPLDTDPADTLVFEVLVTRARGSTRADDVRLISVVTRRRS